MNNIRSVLCTHQYTGDCDYTSTILDVCFKSFTNPCSSMRLSVIASYDQGFPLYCVVYIWYLSQHNQAILTNKDNHTGC